MKRKIVTKDVPSKGEPTTGVTRRIRVDPTSHSIRASRAKPPTFPMTEGVQRKFLRMTLAERTKFVELFAGFGEKEWRSFRRWIRKLGGK